MPPPRQQFVDVEAHAKLKAEADALKKKQLLEEEAVRKQRDQLLNPTPIATPTRLFQPTTFQAPNVAPTPALRSLSEFLPLVKTPGGKEFSEDL